MTDNKIIISLAKKSVLKYKLYEKSINNAIEDLLSESYLILNRYTGEESERDRYLYRELYKYIHNQKYSISRDNERLIPLPDKLLSEYSANETNEIEKNIVDNELSGLFEEFKKSLPEIHKIVFSMLLDEREIKKIAKEVSLSTQRVLQIKDTIARKLHNFLSEKRYDY